MRVSKSATFLIYSYISTATVKTLSLLYVVVILEAFPILVKNLCAPSLQKRPKYLVLNPKYSFRALWCREKPLYIYIYIYPIL